MDPELAGSTFFPKIQVFNNNRQGNRLRGQPKEADGGTVDKEIQ